PVLLKPRNVHCVSADHDAVIGVEWRRNRAPEDKCAARIFLARIVKAPAKNLRAKLQTVAARHGRKIVRKLDAPLILDERPHARAAVRERAERHYGGVFGSRARPGWGLH